MVCVGCSVIVCCLHVVCWRWCYTVCVIYVVVVFSYDLVMCSCCCSMCSGCIIIPVLRCLCYWLSLVSYPASVYFLVVVFVFLLSRVQCSHCLCVCGVWFVIVSLVSCCVVHCVCFRSCFPLLMCDASSTVWCLYAVVLSCVCPFALCIVCLGAYECGMVVARRCCVSMFSVLVHRVFSFLVSRFCAVLPLLLFRFLYSCVLVYRVSRCLVWCMVVVECCFCVVLCMCVAMCMFGFISVYIYMYTDVGLSRSCAAEFHV